MRRGVRQACLLVLLAAFMIAGPAANAKGDFSLTVKGAGLQNPVTFTPAEAGWLMDYSGFWREACSADVCRGRASYARPVVVELGPRYTLTWDLPWHRKKSILYQEVVQYVYPFAQPRSVTYMPPDQLYLLDGRTGGGWFVASPDLLQAWGDLGLPATNPDADRTTQSASVASQGHRWIVWVAIGVLIACLIGAFLRAFRGHNQRQSLTSPVA
jgi:hypothetical protein